LADIVDIAIPAKAQAAAEALGLVVSRSVTDGTRVRRVARDEAEIAIACLRTARLITSRLASPSIHRESHEQKEGPSLVRQPAIGGVGFPALRER
jgi:hypothetical protein